MKELRNHPTNPNRILILPHVAPGDVLTIQMCCQHAVSLFLPCFRCILEDNLAQFEEVRKRKVECFRSPCNDPECRRSHDNDD